MIQEKTGWVRLLTSSKGLAIWLSLAFVFVLELLRIDSKAFADYAWKVVSAYVLGTSVQDAMHNLAARPQGPPAVTVTNNVPSLFPPRGEGS